MIIVSSWSDGPACVSCFCFPPIEPGTMPKTKENSNIDPFPLCRFPWMNDIQHVRLSACAKHTADSRTISDLIKSPREQSHMPAAASQRSWTRTPTHQHQPIPFLTLPSHASHAGTKTAFGPQHQSRRIASLKTSRSTWTLISTKHIIMASLEPPIPASAAHVFENPLGNSTTSTTQEQDIPGSWNVKASSWAKWRRSVGLLLLFVTVFLWTVSNFLASVRNLAEPYDTLRK
jgi:hypothetical protein